MARTQSADDAFTCIPASSLPPKYDSHSFLLALALVIPPIATHFSVVWSVRLSHTCTLLEPFN